MAKLYVENYHVSIRQKQNSMSKEIKPFLRAYSLDDLAKAFFALNLWLPNIASPIRLQFLYCALEDVRAELPPENRIATYQDYVAFCKRVFKLTPSFPSIEDYVPEADWGEIKYFHDGRLYKIFYGADLSNTYDFYYSFELIYKPVEDNLTSLVGRSPFDDFRFALEMQDYILTNLPQVSEENKDVSAGDLSTPSESFWHDAVRFIDTFQPQGIYNQETVDLYTSGGEPQTPLDLTTFADSVLTGKNCPYFFLKHGEKRYPVMPRRYFGLVFERWGAILKAEHTKLTETQSGRNPVIARNLELYKFIRRRYKEKEVFALATPVYPDLKPHGLVFIALRSKGKLFLVHITPPSVSVRSIEKYLEELAPKVSKCKELLSTHPTRLGLLARQEILEFRSSKEGEKLESVFLVVVPYCTTEPMRFKLPMTLDARVLGLDQLVGIVDELRDENELCEFFEYLDEVEAGAKIPGLNSLLDLFGSFRDSHSVLVAGATIPDLIVLDPNWGSNARFRTLKQFWQDFPENNFFGHPRSWTIPVDRKSKTGVILQSRTFLGYAYHQRVGEASFYVNAPVHLMEFESGVITDTLLHSLADAIEIYSDTLQKLAFSKKRNKVQVIFFPAALVRANEKLSHVRHLLVEGALWQMDVAGIDPGQCGVRVVFNENAVVEALRIAKDRSLQVTLLIDVLRQAGKFWPSSEQANVEAALEKEKAAKPRFKTTAVPKRVSFPELVRPLSPGEREFKKADKLIAQLARELGIEPGTYAGEDAKQKLGRLIEKVVEKIDSQVGGLNLEGSLPTLLTNIDALTDEHERHEVSLKMSLEHEVEYERATVADERFRKFHGLHRCYRYLVEKFVQLQGTRPEVLSDESLQELVAVADRLLDIRVVSDYLHYGIYAAQVTINHDFLMSLTYGVNIGDMQEKLGKELAEIRLGVIGKDDDVADPTTPIETYLENLDLAAKIDFGFGLRAMVNVLHVLSSWPTHNMAAKEQPYYCATAEEIARVCAESIVGFDVAKTDAILDFLTLRIENLLKIEGDSKLAKDLPTWEHNKRLTRYSIRPLVRIGERYFWGPHSTDRSCRTWMGTTTVHRLPADIPAPAIGSVLHAGHSEIEVGLVRKAAEIVRRFTPLVEVGVFPHKSDPRIGDIGDYDVLAYLEGKNVLISVESKVIDPAYVLKDLQRIQRRIFGRTKSDGGFEKGDLQRVEDRAAYLTHNYVRVMKRYGWTVPKDPPRIASIFLTRVSYWWTKFPPVITDVEFVQVKLLDEFLSKL